jgi:multiple sugar transport system permease protein
LGFALFLSASVPGAYMLRSLFLLPFVISQVVVGLMFAWFLNPHFGLLNELLSLLGLSNLAPLASERWAIYAVIVAGLWPQTSYCMILYLTGLMNVKPELIDSARVDGASKFNLLRHVIIPQLRPVTFIVVMVCIVSALRSFDLVMTMTRGGPYGASTVLGLYMYEQTFLSYRFGYAATIATVLLLLMAVGVGPFLWLLLKREANQK